nr:MAG TPA: hypothetical protein [Caudoviricetes sp.]
MVPGKVFMYSEINSFKNGGIGTIRLPFTDFVPLM